MDLPSKNTEITLWHHHIKCICYRIFEKKKNLYCENILVFIACREYGLLEIIQDTGIFKTQNLNKSITVYLVWPFISYSSKWVLSFEGFSCQAALWVQFSTISGRWRSCSNWPTESSILRRGRNKYFQDITGHYILLSCPQVRKYCR